MKVRAFLVLFLSICSAMNAEDRNVKIGVTNEVNRVNENKVETLDNGSGTVTIIITKNGATKKITRKKGTPITVENGELIEDESDSVVEAKKASNEGAVKVDEESVKLIDPGLDARKEIRRYNAFIDQIFHKMNGAIKYKRLDPMDLKLMHSDKMDPNKPRIDVREHVFNPSDGEKKKDNGGEKGQGKPNTTKKPKTTTTTTTESIIIFTQYPKNTTTTKKPRPIPPLAIEEIQAEEDEEDDDILQPEEVRRVQGWLHGMSTLKRSGDVSIFIHEDYRTIQCPFSLGPLELRVSKTFGSGKNKKTKTAKATTDLMLGLIDLKIDRASETAEITNVIFDEPGGVDVKGNLKRSESKKKVPYRLVLASKAALSLKKVARLVVGGGNGGEGSTAKGGVDEEGKRLHQRLMHHFKT